MTLAPSPTLPRSARHAATLLTAAFALCFVGSSLYLVQPLRPFHWGLALMALAFCIDAATRRQFLASRMLPLAIGAVALILLQVLWADNMARYAQFGTIIAIGLAYAALGEVLARQGLPCLRWLPWLAALWFVLALVPTFDAWTHSERFRAEFPLTGGPWDNINNMATVLVVANLLWLLVRRRLLLPLFVAAWLYCLVLNRRSDLIAMAMLGAAYLGLLLDAPWRRKVALAAGWAILTAAALVWMNYDGQAARALPQLTMESGEMTVVSAAGDYSTGYRTQLLHDMLDQARAMPWWQWFTGMGAGQLNVKWPVNNAMTPWASPHLFWLEMFFYLGVAWPLFLLWLFWKLPRHGRVSLAVIAIAGIAPSSMVYFQPFWFLLGALLASALPDTATEKAFPAAVAPT